MRRILYLIVFSVTFASVSPAGKSGPLTASEMRQYDKVTHVLIAGCHSALAMGAAVGVQSAVRGPAVRISPKRTPRSTPLRPAMHRLVATLVG
jgi:hypothetical protein